MLYVHVAENHRRDLPAAILEAGRIELDPDRRVLAMLSARGSQVAASASTFVESSGFSSI
jgi:hypothetical protein